MKKASVWSVSRIEWLLFGLAFVVRMLYALFVYLHAGSHGFIAFSDAEYFYYRAGINLVQHGVFSVAQSAPFYPDAYHTPLYPLFLAALFYLRVSLFGVVTVQNAIAAVSTVLTYRIGMKLVSSSRVSVLTAVLFALEPMSIYWSNLLMSDVFASFLLIVSCYALLEEQVELSFLFLALSALARPIGLYFALVFVVLIAYFIWKHRTAISVRRLIVALMIFAITVFPWFLRNKVVFNVWSFSSAGWYVLYVAPLPVFAHQIGVTVPDILNGSTKVYSDLDFTRFDFDHVPFYRSEYLSTVEKAPLAYAVFHAKRSLYSLVSDRYEYLIHDVIAVAAPQLYDRIPPPLITAVLFAGEAFWLGIYVLAFAGVALKRLRPWWFFMVGLVLINITVAGVVNPNGSDMSRYMIGLTPFLFIFACESAREAWARFVKRA